MSDINKGPAKGSGSDTVSAARAATGGAGSSKTAGPGSTAPGPQGAAQSSGPEHNLHQDKTAAQGGGAGQPGAQSGRSGTDAATQAAREAADRVREMASSARETAGELYEQATDWASEHMGRGSRQFSDARRRGVHGASSAQHTIERFIAENPVLVGVVGLAAGLLVGALLPRTRPEDRTFGAWADEMRDQGLRYARDVTHRGREFVEQALSDEDPDSGGSPESRRNQPRGQRSGPAGRYQNH